LDDEKKVEEYFNLVLRGIKISGLIFPVFCNFLQDYQNEYKEKLTEQQRKRIEVAIINGVTPDLVSAISELAKIELNCEFIIYFNELKNGENDEFIDKVTSLIKISYQQIFKYLSFNSNKKVSVNFVRLFEKILIKVEKDEFYLKSRHDYESMLLNINIYISNKSISDEERTIFQNILNKIETLSDKFQISTFDFKLCELMNIQANLERNSLLSQKFIANCENQLTNLKIAKEISSFYENKYQNQISNSSQFSQTIKDLFSPQKGVFNIRL
jgi:hypothetical protein